MNLVPDEELRGKGGLNLAPMVDFLFLIIAVFATISVTRAALFDSEINLAKLNKTELSEDTQYQPDYTVINLGVTASGQYKWITEFNEFIMENAVAIEEELLKQQNLGILSQEHSKTKILLHVDKKAQWESVVEIIFTLKKSGFTISPVYEADEAV
jgi:biopolymer transport protein ExbD